MNNQVPNSHSPRKHLRLRTTFSHVFCKTSSSSWCFCNSAGSRTHTKRRRLGSKCRTIHNHASSSPSRAASKMWEGAVGAPPGTLFGTTRPHTGP